MGAMKEKYLNLLDRLTEAGAADRAASDPLPTDEALLTLAEQILADMGAASIQIRPRGPVEPADVADLRDAYNEGRQPDHLSFDAVSRELSKLGVDSHIEHTSGGTATLYAGPNSAWPDDNGARRRLVSLGPGSYSEERSGVLCGAYGLTHELSYGPVDDIYGGSVQDGATPADVAAAIAAEVGPAAARERAAAIERLTP